MSNIVLRPSQIDCINSIFLELQKHDKALVSAPCGFGKTVVFSSLVEKIIQHRPNFRAIILVNKNILIGQTVSKFNIPVGIYSAGMGSKNLSHPITVASVQSLVNAKELKVDCLIVDEVHSLRLDSGQGEKVFNKLGEPKVIGFTATPYYPNGRPIYGEGEFFDRLCYEKSLKEHTVDGFLAPITFAGQISDTKIDVSNVKKRQGEFVLSDLEKVVLDNKHKVRKQVNDVLNRAEGRRKIAYLCVSIKHAEMVYSELLLHGEKAALLHSKNSIGNFDDMDTRHLVSVMMITTGWDYPELDCLVLMRPTRSYSLYVQSVGRVARQHFLKNDGLVLDYGEIVDNLGDVYDLKPNDKKKKPLRMCEECGVYCSMSATKCPSCHNSFMTMCEFCLEMKFLGVPCKCGGKKKRDLLKNLTFEAHGEASPWKTIDRISASDYVSKMGNKCIKIDYWQDWRLVVTEYFTLNTSPFLQKKLDDFMHFTLGEMVENITADKINSMALVPFDILVVKDGKYNRVQSRKHTQSLQSLHERRTGRMEH